MDKVDITEGILKTAALLGGFLGGIFAAMLKRPRPVNGRTSHVGIMAMESECSQIVRSMRHETEKNFSERDEEFRAIVRRIRRHDDDIDSIKSRLSLLEEGTGSK